MIVKFGQSLNHGTGWRTLSHNSLTELVGRCIRRLFKSLGGQKLEHALIHTDAVNMATVTCIPAIFWAGFWIMLALGILWFVMRLYVAGRDKSFQPDLPFEESPTV